MLAFVANEADAVQVPALLTAVPQAGLLQAEIPQVAAPKVEIPRVAVPRAEVPQPEALQVEALRALAHPVRWGILRRLAAEPGICACDFTEFFDVSQPTISAHLKVLREAGLVTTRRTGTTICYSIAPGRLDSLSRILGDMAATAAMPPPEASSAR
jgi:ArsR family transcriptional regulator